MVLRWQTVTTEFAGFLCSWNKRKKLPLSKVISFRLTGTSQIMCPYQNQLLSPEDLHVQTGIDLGSQINHWPGGWNFYDWLRPVGFLTFSTASHNKKYILYQSSVYTHIYIHTHIHSKLTIILWNNTYHYYVQCTLIYFFVLHLFFFKLVVPLLNWFYDPLIGHV